MGEDSDAEDAEVEEEEEGEEWQDIDVSGMSDGKKSVWLGGVSELQDVEEAVRICENEGVDTVIVGEGRFGVLRLEHLDGVTIKGNGVKGEIVFEGCTTTCTCYVTDVTFSAPPEKDESALAVMCVDKKIPKPVFTNCDFSGGKQVVAVHACAAPALVACNITSTHRGLYCFPRSAPELHTGYLTLNPTPSHVVKPTPGTEASAVGILPAATYVRVVSKEAADEEGTVYWLVGTPQGSMVYVKMQDLDYVSPVPCSVLGKAMPGSVGLFCDDAKAVVNGAVIKQHETGCCMQYTCKGSCLQDVTVEDVSGTGIYLTSGCRPAIRGCRVRNCAHYGLIVDKGGGTHQCGEVGLMCRDMENAFIAKDGAKYNSILDVLRARKVTVSMHKRQWIDAGTSETGTWPPCETQPILRENIFNANVRVNNGTAPSFFGNVIVKPHEAKALNKFSLNGILPVGEEPKVKVPKREDEAEE